MLSSFRSLAGVALLASFARLTAAQVSTACQPLNTTGCPADPAFGTDYLFNFNVTPSTSFWETTAGTVSYTNDSGAAFTINKQGDSPTIRTNFYIFFGRTEMWIKAASGTGIISSVMYLSDDLDEIDWEFMGGNATHVETNYFGKGRQDYLNAIYHPVTGGILDDYHNYTTDWTSDAIDFYVDGSKVRTLLPAEANSTHNYPQTPMRVSVGIWAGGDPTLPKGTREWAGGDTDYTKGPFTMYLKSCQVTDYSSGKEYSYGDFSGSWESIVIAEGNSTAKTALFTKTKESETLAQKWNNLSSTAKIAVYASGAGVGALIAAVGLYYCIRQRRRGAEENRLYEERMAQERMELNQLKKDGINPDSLAASGSEYNARDMSKDGMTSGNAYNIPPGTPDSVADEKERAWAAAAGTGVAAGALGGAAVGAGAAAAAQRNGYNNVPLNSPLNSPHLQQQRGASPGPMSPHSGHVSPVSPAFPFQSNMNMGSPRSQTQSPAFAAPTPQRSYTGHPFTIL
ncbi:glycoside hydrolase family 16 protein [Ophiostoma piceae UAMH 11346]|uniref:chitinase n=1 Tax=Ophiostoma piceae (strain UAMH 11346) TaxID=1262450 RepID=S3CNG3_OPHP1|nr:glycoside hydrolase family 16 protein [Ophiostoma piceae UAMH 11346]